MRSYSTSAIDKWITRYVSTLCYVIARCDAVAAFARACRITLLHISTVTAATLTGFKICLLYFCLKYIYHNEIFRFFCKLKKTNIFYQLPSKSFESNCTLSCSMWMDQSTWSLVPVDYLWCLGRCLHHLTLSLHFCLSDFLEIDLFAALHQKRYN